MIGVAALVSFVAGVTVGVLLREAWEITRHPEGSSVLRFAQILLLLPESFRRITGARSRTVGILLVTIALAANAVLGFLLITTRTAVDDLVTDVSELAGCGERYNRASGEARDERDARAKLATEEEIDLWRDLEAALSADTGSSVPIRDRIRAYRAELQKLQETRVENPYPDPDLCRRLVP